MAATYLSKAGLAKLQEELEELKKHKRRLSQEVGKAREWGDLRENGEYHAAKERLGQVLQKIGELEFKLSNVQIIESSQLREGVVSIGTEIRVKDLTRNKEETYILVGADESDPAGGKISILSPLGKAFVGHKVNEKVTVILPAGQRPYQILSVKAAE